MLFYPTFIISSLLSFSMSSWIGFWMIMEMNLLSIIMLMLFDKLIKFELLMKYFLFQAFNSYLYLINSLGMYLDSFYLNSMLIMNLSMLMKLSIIPFHFWYIKIMMNLNWTNIFNMSIINKIIPLMILNSIFDNYKMNYIIMMNLIIIINSGLISSIVGIMQINLKNIMAYSSMIQMTWLITMMFINSHMMFMYFVIYMMISLNIFYMFYKLNFNNLNQLSNMKFINKMYLFYLMMLMFSLSSVPPLFGFLMKWLSIQILISINFPFYMLIVLIINSLISIFFYFRIMILFMMNYYYSNKNNFKFINLSYNLNYKLIIMNWMNFILLFAYELM